MNEPVTFSLPLQQMMDSLHAHNIIPEIRLASWLFFILSQAEIEAAVKQICFYGAKHCETELIMA